MTSKNKPKTETEPQEEEEKPEIVHEIPKIRAIRRNNSKYEMEFASLQEGEFLKLKGRKQISRYFGALRRLQKQGKFPNLESHTRTAENGEVHGYIGTKK